MGNDRDGSARDARLEKAKPTPLEDAEFKGLVTMMIIVMLCVFGMGVIGIAMMFWRTFG